MGEAILRAERLTPLAVAPQLPPHVGVERPYWSPITSAVDQLIDDRLIEKRHSVEAHGAAAAEAIDSLIALCAGGKRVRTAFVYWGWRAAGVGQNLAAAVEAAGACELMNVGACVLDDVLDGTPLRRGRASAWRRYSDHARHAGWSAGADAYGRQMAMLLGSLSLHLADEVLARAGDQVGDRERVAARYVWAEMLTDAWAGQVVDLTDQAARGTSLPPASAVQHARRLALVKTRYTVTHPLQLGATLAGAGAPLLKLLRVYGDPVSEAFQLRDDVLGVFGDPTVTGKPVGEDLREGQQTILTALARQRATPAQAALIDRHLGDPQLDGSGVASLRQVFEDTGARAETDRLLRTLVEQANEALRRFRLSQEVEDALSALATQSACRDR